MSVSVSMYSKGNHEFNTEAYITSNQYSNGDYPVIKIETREEQYGGADNVTIFPSFEQAKQLHKELSKLMKHIAAIEKGKK